MCLDEAVEEVVVTIQKRYVVTKKKIGRSVIDCPFMQNEIKVLKKFDTVSPA